MKTFVNALSIFRIIASFALIPLLMLQMYWPAFILFGLAGFSDLFDGWLARSYNATSKIGGVLDHLGDKFLFAVPAIALIAFLQIWLVVIPVILMICRNLPTRGISSARRPGPRRPIGPARPLRRF
jgi:phosphatidylglycerophosphate synthase